MAKIIQKGATIETFIARAQKIGNEPSEETVAAMYAVLFEMYTTSQAAVHRITQSLANSGHMETIIHGNTWEGRIVYGGPSAGSIHDPVRYAEYERRRGGEHDFFAAMPLFDESFENAIATGFESH